MKRLVIIGGGGHGKVVAESAARTKQFSEIAFVDDAFPSVLTCGLWQVIGTTNELAKFVEDSVFIVAIGNNGVRKKLQALVTSLGGEMTSIIDPTAVISDYADIGKGTFIAPNAVVNIDSTLAEGVIINTSASVDHDCEIGPFVHIAPGCRLAGTVTVAEISFLGIGTTVIPGVQIGSNTVIGAGSVVVRNVKSNVTCFGNPARVKSL